jgi:hypothetical protein
MIYTAIAIIPDSTSLGFGTQRIIRVAHATPLNKVGLRVEQQGGFRFIQPAQ